MKEPLVCSFRPLHNFMLEIEHFHRDQLSVIVKVDQFKIIQSVNNFQGNGLSIAIQQKSLFFLSLFVDHLSISAKIDQESLKGFRRVKYCFGVDMILQFLFEQKLNLEFSVIDTHFTEGGYPEVQEKMLVFVLDLITTCFFYFQEGA